MFKKILIANRGDKPSAAKQATLAAQPQRLARAARAGDLAAGARHV